VTEGVFFDRKGVLLYLAQTLFHCHAWGIPHGNVSASNILLTPTIALALFEPFHGERRIVGHYPVLGKPSERASVATDVQQFYNIANLLLAPPDSVDPVITGASVAEYLFRAKEDLPNRTTDAPTWGRCWNHGDTTSYVLDVVLPNGLTPQEIRMFSKLASQYGAVSELANTLSLTFKGPAQLDLTLNGEWVPRYVPTDFNVMLDDADGDGIAPLDLFLGDDDVADIARDSDAAAAAAGAALHELLLDTDDVGAGDGDGAASDGFSAFEGFGDLDLD